MPDHGFKVGDRVILLTLDDWFFNKLPAGDVAFLKTCIGRETAIEDFDEHGNVELEFESSQSSFHFVWVDPSWIKKV